MTVFERPQKKNRKNQEHLIKEEHGKGLMLKVAERNGF